MYRRHRDCTKLDQEHRKSNEVRYKITLANRLIGKALVLEYVSVKCTGGRGARYIPPAPQDVTLTEFLKKYSSGTIRNLSIHMLFGSF